VPFLQLSSPSSLMEMSIGVIRGERRVVEKLVVLPSLQGSLG
jgi:hypothetical protein